MLLCLASRAPPERLPGHCMTISVPANCHCRPGHVRDDRQPRSRARNAPEALERHSHATKGPWVPGAAASEGRPTRGRSKSAAKGSSRQQHRRHLPLKGPWRAAHKGKIAIRGWLRAWTGAAFHGLPLPRPFAWSGRMRLVVCVLACLASCCHSCLVGSILVDRKGKQSVDARIQQKVVPGGCSNSNWAKARGMGTGQMGLVD